MSQFIDSYYLIDSRASDKVYNFFVKYSFVEDEITENYHFPQYSDSPERIFYSAGELLLLLEDLPTHHYVIYWKNKNEESPIKQFTLQ